MQSSLYRLGIIAALSLLPVIAAAQESLQKAYTDEELVEILKNDGYRAVDISDDRVLTVKIDGLTYVLFIYEDDDLQLYFGVTGYVLDENDMNDWNRTKRLSRAYIDDEGDPVLEADLLANAGYTAEQFIEWIEVFNFSAREFQQFLIENDKSE